MWRPVKLAVLRAANGLSLTHLVASSDWRRRRLAILCYHGISEYDEHEWNPRFYISARRFADRLRLLRDGGYNVLPLADAVRRMYEGTLPHRSVCLTFDDGLFDFYRLAWPLLSEYGFPTTLYLTTFYVHHQRPVFGMICAYLLWKGRQYRGDKLLDFDFRPDLATEEGRSRALASILSAVRERKLSLAERDCLAGRIAGQLGVDYQQVLDRRILQLMNPRELADLAARGLDLQLHTHRHRTPEDRDLFAREIRDNRCEIGKIAGAPSTGLNHFCYPSGVVVPVFLKWLEEENVATATTCESGLASPGSHRLLLPRVTDTDRLSTIEFESWMAGVGQLLSTRRPGTTATLSPE